MSACSAVCSTSGRLLFAAKAVLCSGCVSGFMLFYLMLCWMVEPGAGRGVGLPAAALELLPTFKPTWGLMSLSAALCCTCVLLCMCMQVQVHICSAGAYVQMHVNAHGSLCTCVLYFEMSLVGLVLSM